MYFYFDGSTYCNRAICAKKIFKLLINEIARTSMYSAFDCADVAMALVLDYLRGGLDSLFDTVDAAEADNLYYISADVCSMIIDIDHAGV